MASRGTANGPTCDEHGSVVGSSRFTVTCAAGQARILGSFVTSNAATPRPVSWAVGAAAGDSSAPLHPAISLSLSRPRKPARAACPGAAVAARAARSNRARSAPCWLGSGWVSRSCGRDLIMGGLVRGTDPESTLRRLLLDIILGCTQDDNRIVRPAPKKLSDCRGESDCDGDAGTPIPSDSQGAPAATLGSVVERLRRRDIFPEGETDQSPGSRSAPWDGVVPVRLPLRISVRSRVAGMEPGSAEARRNASQPPARKRGRGP
jgi:hypothetical protein